MDQWLLFSTIHSKLKSNASDSASRRCSEQRLDLICADAAEPVFPAAPPIVEVQALERSRGTGQLRN